LSFDAANKQTAAADRLSAANAMKEDLNVEHQMQRRGCRRDRRRAFAADDISGAGSGGQRTNSSCNNRAQTIRDQVQNYNTAQDPSTAGRRTYGQAPKAAPSSHSPFIIPQEDPDFHGDNGG
jgi:hypothetical protein